MPKPKAKANAKPVTLTVDELEVTVPEGTSVLDAAKAAGVYIPYLCAHPALRPWGACRMCTVEIEGARGIPTSCTTPVGPGMVVHTNTPQVLSTRRNVMELILTEHPIGCLSCHKRDQCGPQETCLRSVAVDFRCVTCPANYRCELQMNCDYVGLDEMAMPIRTKFIPLRKDPLIALDWNLCIYCGRCVRVCDEVRVESVYGMIDRAGGTMMDTMEGAPLADAGCIFCGACVDVCPVGAIEERRNRFAGVADSVTESICNYCSDGCSFRLEQKKDTLIRVAPIWEGEVSGGMYCVKGRFATAEPLHNPARLTTPLVRKDGQLVESTWDEALSTVAAELGARRGNSIGVIGSVRTTNEASYLLQKLARTALQTPNIDTTARLSDTAGLIGMHDVLGVGASTATHDSVGETDCILLVGNNITQTSPITGMKLMQAVRNQVKVGEHTGYFSYLPDVGVREHSRPVFIVIDPRKIEVAQYADLWLRPRPGTDRVLLGAMLKAVLDGAGFDRAAFEARANGVEELIQALEPFTLDAAARITGVPAEDIAEAARLYASAESAVSIFGRGLTQQADGTASVRILSALAVAAGHIGKPNAGVLFPVGSNNTRGAFDLGLLPEYLPGYQASDDENARARLGQDWGAEIVAANGLRLQEQFQAVVDGKVTAMYIVGANPAQSAAEGAKVAEALDKLEFLVVQDLYLTETAQQANVVLPAAAFSEQDGSFTNAERRVQRIRRSVRPAGDSRPDWLIISEIGRLLGASGFDAVHPMEVFDEIARLSPVHHGMSYSRLDDGPIAWPCLEEAGPGLETLFEDGGTFSMPIPEAPQAGPEAAGYPVLLGLTSDYFHFGTGTQTRLVKQFGSFRTGSRVEIGPETASAAGLADGQRVRVVSQHGFAEGTAHITSELPDGVAAMALVFPEAKTNHLFGPEHDAESGTPVFKSVPVRLEALV